MKTKDIGLLAVIAIISAVASVILSGLLISSTDKKQTVRTVEPISAELQRPPDEYFNESSINPTQEIQIGQDNNSQPFGGQ